MTPSVADIADGFALTEFFLARNVLGPRGAEWPAARARFIAAALRGNITEAATG